MFWLHLLGVCPPSRSLSISPSQVPVSVLGPQDFLFSSRTKMASWSQLEAKWGWGYAGTSDPRDIYRRKQGLHLWRGAELQFFLMRSLKLLQ